MKKLLLAAALLFCARPASAQNYDAMAKWTDAKVIRYHVSGDFSGTVNIISGKAAGRAGRVTDHVEIDFDWDNAEMKVIGTPAIKNFPTKLISIDEPNVELSGKCPPVKLDGAPEAWTIQSISALSTLLNFKGKRDTAAGSVPYAATDRTGCTSVDAAAATSQPVEGQLEVISAMMLEMPEAMAQGQTTISKDRKSFVQNKNDGWVWTLTPTIVKRMT